MVREWILFAICLGLGGHIALGLILHAPDRWTWQQAGPQGLLGGLAVYAAIQLARSIRWVVKGRGKTGTSA